MNINLNNSEFRTKACIGFPLLGLCLLLLSASTQKADSKQADVNCAFLANDSNRLSAWASGTATP